MVTKKTMEIKKEKKVVNLFILISLFSLASCSHRIEVRTPSARFISPEAGGELMSGEINMYLASGTTAEVDLKNGMTNNPLVLSNESKAILTDSIGLSADIGIYKDLDILAVSNGSDTPSLIGLKYQIIGANRTTAQKGNHSLSITFMGGSSTETDDDGEDLELVPTDDDTTTELDLEATDLSLIYGYRYSNTALIYGGVSYTKSKFSGKLESENAMLDGKTIKYNALIHGAHIGVMNYLSKNASFKFEANMQEVKWTKTESKTFGFLTAGFGIHW